jgi:hypothetical protein
VLLSVMLESKLARRTAATRRPSISFAQMTASVAFLLFVSNGLPIAADASECSSQQVTKLHSRIEVTPAIQVVLEDVKSANGVAPAQNVRPGPPANPILQSVRCLDECDCSSRYRLQEITEQSASSLREMLVQLNQSPMFGCRELEGMYVGRTYVPDIRCKFVRAVILGSHNNVVIQDGEILTDEYKGHKGIYPSWPKNKFLTVWIECTVRVDLRGLPLGEADSRVMPILVGDGKREFEIIQEIHQSKIKCEPDVTFNGKAFDFSSCGGNMECLRKIRDVFVATLRDEFSKDPLSATEIHDQPVPPGEIWMRSQYKPSKILGPPYFELSTYVLKLWFASSENHGYVVYEPDVTSKFLYINASESFTRSVGVSGTYEEPPPEQVSAYKTATNEVLLRALESTCHHFHGRMLSSVCKI